MFETSSGMLSLLMPNDRLFVRSVSAFVRLAQIVEPARASACVAAVVDCFRDYVAELRIAKANHTTSTVVELLRQRGACEITESILVEGIKHIVNSAIACFFVVCHISGATAGCWCCRVLTCNTCADYCRAVCERAFVSQRDRRWTAPRTRK